MKLWPTWIIDIISLRFFLVVLSFLALSIIVKLNITFTIENNILSSFIAFPKNYYVDIIIIALTSLSDLINLTFISVIFTIFRRTRKMGLILLICIVVIAISLMYLKPFIGRSNPDITFNPLVNLNDFPLESDSLSPVSRDYSYPSNHISIITAFTYVVGYFLNKKSYFFGRFIWIMPILISFTKMYIFQHYIADIIGGFLYGLIVSVIFSNVLKINEPFTLSRFKGKGDL